jgi:hypothetical protein
MLQTIGIFAGLAFGAHWLIEKMTTKDGVYTPFRIAGYDGRTALGVAGAALGVLMGGLPGLFIAALGAGALAKPLLASHAVQIPQLPVVA